MDTGEHDTATANNQSESVSPVTPCASSQKTTYSLEPSFCQHVPVFSDFSNERMPHRTSIFSSEQYHENEFTKSTETIAPIHSGDYPFSEASRKSGKKRSNSLCENQTPSPKEKYSDNRYKSDPNTYLKRQKLIQKDVNEAGGMLSSGLDRTIGVKYSTPPCTPSTSSSNDLEPRRGSNGPVNMRESPSRYSRAGCRFSPHLSQQMIQQNYREFEKMALRKLINEPCLGDMSFGKIFLDDGEAEDWHSSDLEGLSDEVNSMEAEL